MDMQRIQILLTELDIAIKFHEDNADMVTEDDLLDAEDCLVKALTLLGHPDYENK